MMISVAAIFLALVIQFKHAIKPLIVFAAIPYGMAGSLAALYFMGAPFGFMAFLRNCQPGRCHREPYHRAV